MSEQITDWKARLPEGARLVMVSDPWIAGENLGGSLLFRTLYGILQEQEMPVEWWTVELADDPASRAYHQICFDLYLGIYGGKDIGLDRDFSLFQQQLRFFEQTMDAATSQLLKAAKMKDGDQVLLLDVNVIGMAKALRHGAFQPSMLIEDLRIGNTWKDRNHQNAMEFLRQIGIYDALDVIEHLHPSFITDPSREVSLGGFYNFADEHCRPMTVEEAWSNIDRILAQGGTTDRFEDFNSSPGIHEGPLMISDRSRPICPPKDHLMFYQAARIDPTKNLDLILKAYAQAWKQNSSGMTQTSLVLLMPSPSALNNTVELESIGPLVEELFAIYQSLDDETKKHVYIYFVPGKLEGFGSNRLFNESFQNVATVQVNVSKMEGMGNAILDGMSHRKVPLLHAHSGMIGTVEDGRSGFYIKHDTTDELAAAYQRIADRDDLDQVGEAAYQRLIDRFHPLKYIVRFFDLALDRMGKPRTSRLVFPDQISPEPVAGIATDANRILNLFESTRIEYGQDFALALALLAIYSKDTDQLSQTLETLKNQIVAPFIESLGDDFDSLSLREKAYKIKKFIALPHAEAFSREYLPLVESLKRVAKHQGPVGDCNNLSLVYFFLSRAIGLPVNYYTDVYHSFLSLFNPEEEVPVDLAYSDDIVETYYEVNDKGVVAKDSGRQARRLTNRQILALFLCRLATEHTEDQEQKRKIFEAVRTIDPSFAEAHNNLGDIHFARGEYEEALKSYERAIKREEYNIFYKINHLLTRYVIDQDMDKQILLSGIEELLEIYPMFAEAFYFRYLLTGNEADSDEATELGYKVRTLLGYCQEVEPKLDYIKGRE